MILKFILVLGIIIVVGVLWIVFSGIEDKQTMTPPAIIDDKLIKIRETDPFRGDMDAPIELLMVGSFTCPACRNSLVSVEQIQALYPEQIKVVWKDLPESTGISYNAAIAARCAQHQGMFWEYSDALLNEQADLLNLIDLIEMAKELELVVEPFRDCLNSSLAKTLIDNSIDDALTANVDNIPYFQINDIIRLSGYQSFNTLRQAIEPMLKAL